MKRRDFIFTLAGAALWPLAAYAESAKKLGMLMGIANDAEGQARITAFKTALRDLGWIEGRNFTIDIRWVAADQDLARTYAREIAQNCDVILAANTISVEMLLQETRSKPIIFVSVFDPIESGFISNLAHPGGNVTGFINHEPSMGEKWVEYLKEIAPSISNSVLMFNPATMPNTDAFYSETFEKAGSRLNVRTDEARVSSAPEVESTILRLKRAGGGLAVMADPFTTVNRRLIIDLANRYGVPAIYPWTFFVRAGGLISFGVDLLDIFRRSANYVDRVLRGANPGDLPVQAPTRFELAVNSRTAAALGLKIPPSLLVSAEVIE